MGAALGFALTRSIPETLLIFGFLGTGMALPYLVLSLAPGLLERLPRPGPWMETLKQVLAFPMFATVIWLIWVFGQQTGVGGATYLLSSLLLVTAAGWMVGRWQRTDLRSGIVARVVSLAMFAVAFALVAPGQRHRKPPLMAVGDGWLPFTQEEVERTLAQGKPVFVDFTAAWCLTCQVNERVVSGNGDGTGGLPGPERGSLQGRLDPPGSGDHRGPGGTGTKWGARLCPLSGRLECRALTSFRPSSRNRSCWMPWRRCFHPDRRTRMFGPVLTHGNTMEGRWTREPAQDTALWMFGKVQITLESLMDRSLTLNGVTIPRILSFVSGLGMIVASAMTIEHYFAANFPETIFEGSFCDINAFFNCDSSAFSEISQIGGVPLGFFGVIVGALVFAGDPLPFPGLRAEQQEHLPPERHRGGDAPLLLRCSSWEASASSAAGSISSPSSLHPLLEVRHRRGFSGLVPDDGSGPRFSTS